VQNCFLTIGFALTSGKSLALNTKQWISLKSDSSAVNVRRGTIQNRLSLMFQNINTREYQILKSHICTVCNILHTMQNISYNN